MRNLRIKEIDLIKSKWSANFTGLLVTILLFSLNNIYSQVGIGTLEPNNSSQLDITSLNKGLLIPRIQLKATTDASTILNGNVESLLVYNTENAADVTKGYYYWNGTIWERIINNTDINNLVANGLDGKSAYEIWLAAGHMGTESVYLASLVGDTGDTGDAGLKGDTGDAGDTGADSTIAGPKGDTGDAGADSTVVGPKGDTGDAGADSTVAGPKGDTGEKGDAGVNALTTLTNGKVYVGNGSNEAAEVSINGDATIANTGALTIANDAVTTVKILDGAITKTKLVSTTTGSDNGKVLGIKSDGTGLEWKFATGGVLYTEDFMEDNATPKAHFLAMSVLGTTANNFKVSLNGIVISPSNIAYDPSNGTNGSIQIIGIPVYNYDVITVAYTTIN